MERVAGLGSSGLGSPRTAAVWSVLRGELARRADPAEPVTALDVGGGSGMFAVPLAEAGVAVTVLDLSADALATLQRRAAEAGVAHLVTAVQGDADRLAGSLPAGAYDLVLCHSLLEVLDDPAAAVAAMAGALRDGGCVSLLAPNRAAAVLARALSGRLADAGRLLHEAGADAGPGERVRRRFDTASLTALLESAGLAVEAVHGVRVVADLVPGAVLDGQPGGAEALRDLELALSAAPPYRDIATQLHVLGRKLSYP